MTESSLRRIVWVFPDRESTRNNAKWNAAFWQDYADVAKELGLTWQRTSPEAITVDGLDPRDPKVYVDGERVTPGDTIFITSLYTLAYQMVDAFTQYTLYSVLEQAGFYLPHPPALAAMVNDKLATLLFLKDSPVPPIPTVRIGTGRDLIYDEFTAAIADLTYPAVAKPAGWGSSRGVSLARDDQDVRSLLSIAQGGDTTLVFQPYLGDGTVDIRLYMVNGEVVATLLRAPGKGSIYPQLSTGARVGWTELPGELAAVAPWFAEKIPVPYLCVDFLHDGKRFWLSEIELDGGIFNPDASSAESLEIQLGVIRDRFAAYRDAHTTFIAQHGHGKDA